MGIDFEAEQTPRKVRPEPLWIRADTLNAQALEADICPECASGLVTAWCASEAPTPEAVITTGSWPARTLLSFMAM